MTMQAVLRRFSPTLRASLRALGLAATTVLAGCAANWPGFDAENTATTIAPEYTALRMSGRTRMEFGSPPVRGGRIAIADLGADDREDNVGVRAAYGDGVSGLEFHYGRFEAQSSQTGIATSDWGAITSGATVATRVTMDEFRLRYIAGFTLYQDPEDEQVWFKVGAGGLFGHKELTLDVRDVNSTNAQKIEIKDDVTPMVAIRLAGRRGPFRLTVDAALNADWPAGTGDLEGEFYDISARVSYEFQDQDLRVFAGYRRLEIPARGNDGPLEFDTDFRLEGYVLGFEFEF